jgi:hypothetical protein
MVQPRNKVNSNGACRSVPTEEFGYIHMAVRAPNHGLKRTAAMPLWVCAGLSPMIFLVCDASLASAAAAAEADCCAANTVISGK